MRVLHLVSSGGYYGKENVIVNLCSALTRLGYTAEIGAFLNSEAPNDEVVIRARLENLSARTFFCRGRLDLRTIRAIREYVISQKVDLIHTHDTKANCYGYAVAKSLGRFVFATCHLWYSKT